MGVSDILIVGLFLLVGAGTPIFILVQSLFYYLHKLQSTGVTIVKAVGMLLCWAVATFTAVIVAMMGVFEINEERRYKLFAAAIVTVYALVCLGACFLVWMRKSQPRG